MPVDRFVKNVIQGTSTTSHSRFVFSFDRFSELPPPRHLSAFNKECHVEFIVFAYRVFFYVISLVAHFRETCGRNSEGKQLHQ